MAKVNKLALARLALRQTLSELDNKELLCILADMYTGVIPDYDVPRWYGNGGGTSGLEQGIYNSMITFRRVSNLWKKILHLTTDQKQETYNFRDFIVTKLKDRGVKLEEIQEQEADE